MCAACSVPLPLSSLPLLSSLYRPPWLTCRGKEALGEGDLVSQAVKLKVFRGAPAFGRRAIPERSSGKSVLGQGTCEAVFSAAQRGA